MEKRSEWIFLTFVGLSIPFTYIPPTGNECGQKPIAMYVISRYSWRCDGSLPATASCCRIGSPPYSLWQMVIPVIVFCVKLSKLNSHSWRLSTAGHFWSVTPSHRFFSPFPTWPLSWWPAFKHRLFCPSPLYCCALSLSLSLSLSLPLSLFFLFVSLSFSLSVSLSLCLSLPPSLSLSLCPFVYLSLSFSLCLPLSLSLPFCYDNTWKPQRSRLFSGIKFVTMEGIRRRRERRRSESKAITRFTHPEILRG